MRRLGNEARRRSMGVVAIVIIAASAAAGIASAGAPGTALERAPAGSVRSSCVGSTRTAARFGRLGDCIGLGAREDSALLLERAIQHWRACQSFGSGFPALQVGAGCLQTVAVDHLPVSSGTRYCGTFQGRQITVYASAVGRGGRPVSCGDPALVLAHELGHVLGLEDAPPGAACRAYVMASATPWPEPDRRVQPEECALADAHWSTRLEPFAADLVTADDPASRSGEADSRAPEEASLRPLAGSTAPLARLAPTSSSASGIPIKSPAPDGARSSSRSSPIPWESPGTPRDFLRFRDPGSP